MKLFRGLFLFLALPAFVLATAKPTFKVFNDGHLLKPLSSIKLDAEIAAFMPAENRLFVVGGNTLSVVDFRDPAKIKVMRSYELGEEISSVSVTGNIVAVAQPGENGREGTLKLFEYAADSLKELFSSKTCNTLDMITFTPDGKKLVGACEGERANDQSVDAKGLVLVASFENGFAKPNIKLLGFEHFDPRELIKAGVRNGYGTSPSLLQALEPEYVTVSEDSKTAWVSLQENNAMARVDLQKDRIDSVIALGYMDFSKVPVAVRSGKEIVFENLPLFGMRQPDGIAVKTIDGVPYIFTADEGADMQGNSFSDSENIASKLKRGELDETVFNKNVQDALEKVDLSKDRCGTRNGKDTCAFVYGTRSFSIFNGNTGDLVWTSNDMIEKKMAEVAPEFFNWNAKKKKIKVNARSGDKGSSPESVVIGEVGKKRYAFVGLERMNGVVAFDVTDPKNPKYASYYMTPEHRGPEGILFIPAQKSPNKKPVLVVCYEFSGHLTVYDVKIF